MNYWSVADEAELYRLLREDEHAAARERLIEFACYVDPPAARWYKARHLAQIAAVLERVERGELTRVIISCPPRGWKSSLVSEKFATWWLSKHPESAVILASYALALAEKFSRTVRDTIEGNPRYHALFPDVRLRRDSTRMDDWTLETGTRSSFRAVGVGGGLTGHGANCLAGNTLVMTEHGNMPIANVTVGMRVLAFDHQSDLLVWRRVLATRVTTASELVQIRMINGATVLCTPEHGFHMKGTGYVKAEVLGECPQETRRVSGLRDADNRSTFKGVSCVLQQNTQSNCLCELQDMWENQATQALRIREGTKARATGILLQSRVCQLSARNSLLQVWEQGATNARALLFGQVRSEGASRRTTDNSLSNLRRVVSSIESSDGTLFSEMCGLGTQSQDEGNKQSELQTREWGERVPTPIPRDATYYPRTRQQAVCGLWRDTLAGSSSHRQQSAEQLSNKLSDSMQEMSQEDTLKEFAVISVERIHTGGIQVYDIQVEGTHNFFANGILTHNCLIIDDPISDYEAAQSETQRNNLWEWYRQVLRTRAESGAAIVLIQTRWHEQDLAGRLIEEQSRGGEQWHILNIPAVAGNGESYWSERFSEQDLAATRAAVGEYAWRSLYLGNPTAAQGNEIHREWFAYFARLPEGAAWRVRWWDLAITEKQVDKPNPDFSASVCATLHDGDLWLGSPVLMRQTWFMVRTEIRRLYEQERTLLLGAGKDMIATMTMQELVRAGVPFAQYKELGDKRTRAQAWTRLAEQGRVKLVGDAREWEQFLAQWLAFPSGAHDDAIDAVSGVAMMLGLVFDPAPQTADAPPQPARYRAEQEAMERMASFR